MRALLSMYELRGDVEPMVGRVVRVRELGAQCDMVVSVAEGGDARVSTGRMTSGGWL